MLKLKGGRLVLLLTALGLLAAVGIYFALPLLGSGQTLADSSIICHTGKCDKVSAAGLGNRPVLNPMQFVGPIRQAYIAAQQNPVLFSQLHCYCGCDRTNGHRSLLDCYRDFHGATCAICNGEALEAEQLFEQGSPVEQIREALRVRYAPR